MTAKILDGRQLAGKIKQELKGRLETVKRETNRVPGLAYLLVDDDPVSKHYIAGKTKACNEIGMNSFVEVLPANILEEALLYKIDSLNARPEVHGIIVQLPLPERINVHRVLERVHPKKDADGFHPYNRGLLFSSHTAIVPCTPKGIIALLKENQIPLEGKHVVILGRSLVVGRPLLMLSLNENATVTICHSKTENLKTFTRSADILVAAIGKPKFVTAEHVKPGAVVIDVGIHQVEGKLVGDVDADSVSQVASAMTPVPGGVGPMTVAMLLTNTFQAFQNALADEAGATLKPTSHLGR